MGAKSCAVLLEEFSNSTNAQVKGEKLKFLGANGMELEEDVYNITPPLPLRVGGELRIVIGARVENREPPLCSRIKFFEATNNIYVWKLIKEAPVFEGEDPYIALIGDEIVLHYVKAWLSKWDPRRYLWYFRMIFCRGTDLLSLRKFMVGPPKHKGIKLFPLASGNIGVFTRPHNKPGFIKIADLKQLSEEVINKARVLENIFVDDEWGGVNAPFSRKDDDIGFVGHIACFNEPSCPGRFRGRDYYGTRVDHFNSETLEFTPPHIIITRDMLPPGPAKKEGLRNVWYTGGFNGFKGETAYFGGYVDAHSGMVVRQEEL